MNESFEKNLCSSSFCGISLYERFQRTNSWLSILIESISEHLMDQYQHKNVMAMAARPHIDMYENPSTGNEDVEKLWDHYRIVLKWF